MRVSNSVTTNEDCGLDTNNVLIDVDSVPAQILDISNVEIVIVPEEDESDFTKCLDVVEARN